MTVKLDVEQFARDYRVGVKDRDLIAKYKLTAKEMVSVVKKLINDGQITREDYFSRNRRIEELETRQEKDFLKSLHHCPVCSHVHPTPFTVCPACGADVSAYAQEPDQPSAEALEAEAKQAVPLTAIKRPSPPELSFELEKKTGMALEKLALFQDLGNAGGTEGYKVGALISGAADAGLFAAEPGDPHSQRLLVKLLDPKALPETGPEELFKRIVAYQSAMADRNVLKIMGRGLVGGDTALVYEYMPMTLEALIEENPEGLSMDLLAIVVPQILNAVGYSHMHRGTDGTIRRLPHLRLTPSKFLFDPATQRVKLEECGVWRAFVDVRGHKSRLWEDMGADLASLGPECFVLESKSVNWLLADIYALGVTLYKLITAESPFLASTREEYRVAHLKKFPIPPRVHRYSVPKWLDRMILKCLEKEPPDRWRSATQMEISMGKEYAESA